MGRERDKKGAGAALVQQQWQAKPPRFEGGASSLFAQNRTQDQVHGYLETALAEYSPTYLGDGRGSGGFKDMLSRTKVVVRRLPPLLSQQAFMAQIECKFAGTYTWVAFHPGQYSHGHQKHSRAYINFISPEDVFNFYDDFSGHVFVNERGAQFKAIVEYAPYQRVPELRPKKDTKEGAIYKDPDYLEFLDLIAKPTELLPSAEIQLERREAEKAAFIAAGGAKDSVVVTPLMEYVRQRRAAKAMPQRSLSKLALRAGIIGPAPANFLLQKRNVDKGKSVISSYGDTSSPTSKEGSSYVSVSRRDEHSRRERELLGKRRKDIDLKDRRPSEPGDAQDTHSASDANTGTQFVAEPRSPQIGKVKVQPSDGGDLMKDSSKKELMRRKQLLVKEKDKECLGNAATISLSKHARDGGKAVRLIGRDQSFTDVEATPQNTAIDERSYQTSVGAQDGRRIRNKDRPDRPVWTPRRRLDQGLNKDEANETSQNALVRTQRSAAGAVFSHEGLPNDSESGDVPDVLAVSNRNGSFCGSENGNHKLTTRRERNMGQGYRDGDGVEVSKPIKRGNGGSPFGGSEKQVWVAVQRSG